MGPDVGTVVADKNRNVADKAYVAFGTVGAQRPPLLIESKLDSLLNLEIIPALLLQPEERIRVAMCVLPRPGRPGTQGESLPQHDVARVIQQPKGILFPKALEADPLLIVVVR